MRGEYIKGDCMEYLSGYGDNHFNLAIVDPPYGIGAAKMRLNNSKYKSKNWDNKTPNMEYFEELFRVSKNQLIWGANHFIEFLKSCKNFVIWDKKQPEGVSFSMAEFCWSSFKCAPKVFYMFPSHVTQGKRIHPTQKPVALYRWLLQNYAKPNDLILDTHVGSASSLIACEIEGFNYVGFEKDSDYYQQSTKRIKQHLAQMTMF